MPVNPILVLLVNTNGDVTSNANNIGNDLKIVVTYDEKTFAEEAAGKPYVGSVE